MNRRTIFLLIALISASVSFGFLKTQEDPLKNLLQKLDKYKAKNVHEKVHLHTDRPYYAIGDTIWFKAYVVIAERNQLSALSKFLYVDLINEKDSLKKSLRLNLTNGMAYGDFVLSDSLTEGNYRLRAYTTWMRNFGDEFFFDKTFAVGNILSHQVISTATFNYSKTGIRENVTADINYSDINGQALANKEVTYNVQLDFRNIASGKGTTDANGNLQVKFSNNQPFVLKSGRINTTVKLDEKVKVNKSIPVKSTSAETDVQFFPEGGNLISGLRTKVGIKAVGSDGVSREASGYITDNQNNRITEFETEHAGIGTFMLIPEQGKPIKPLLSFGTDQKSR